jgi:hypothetical protein
VGKFGQMVVHSIVRWSVVPAMVFAVSAAVAQTGGSVPTAGGAHLRAACAGDLQRFCVGVQPGGGRLIQCLAARTRELSEGCRNVIATAGGGVKLRAACGDELQRFCVGVRPGEGRLIQCLAAHTREVSAACENVIAMRNRGDDPGSSAQSPAAQPAAPVTIGKPPAALGSILRASCGPDAQRLCAAARRENEVLKCLDDRRMELSTVCSSYFEKLGARPTAQKNTPKKLPPVAPAAPPSRPPGNDNPPEPGPG